MITSGSTPAAQPGGKTNTMAKEHNDFGCEDHAEAMPFHEHPDGMHHKHADHLEEHERGAGHPAHHTKGKMRSQLNPDHGPHGVLPHQK